MNLKIVNRNKWDKVIAPYGLTNHERSYGRQWLKLKLEKRLPRKMKKGIKKFLKLWKTTH